VCGGRDSGERAAKEGSRGSADRGLREVEGERLAGNGHGLG
jgi:hypothetical protein